MGTEYAVIMYDPKTQERQVSLNYFDGKPITSATRACIFIEEFKAMFPDYQYTWGAVTRRPSR